MDGLAEGRVLAGRYLVGPVVGHGAMGEVRLAEDAHLARPVAIKSLRPELARSAEARQRFGHEARAAARISHPNVVRVYDWGEEDEIPYLVMECLPGPSLVDELAWGPLEPARARRVGLDVLGALDAAHRLGVVHRDVKPGNILLTSTLDGPAKVSDFGIAMLPDDNGLPDPREMVGTPAYLAPERVAGGVAGPACDLYSVGVVLYECMAGRRPYEGQTAISVALAIYMGGAPSLLELRPDLDPVLGAVVDRALAHDPADRWESAAAMREALRSWRPGGDVGHTGAAPAIVAPAATVVADAPTAALTAAAPLTKVAGAAVDADGRVCPATPRSVMGNRRPLPAQAPGPARRGRVALLCVGAAGLVVALAVVGLASRSKPGTGGPAAPPTTTLAASSPSSTSTPDISAAPTSLPVARPARRPAPAVTAAAPTTTPRPTTTTLRSPTTRRPTTTTTPTTVSSITAPPTTPAPVAAVVPP